YVFCPEHRTGAVEPIYAERSGAARLWLFGPALLPDEDCLAEPRAAAHSEPIASDEEASRPTTVVEVSSGVEPVSAVGDAADVLVDTET
ncbi:hypothetical protein, partial [Streptococcus pneumoniae]|uniref:hypothetical protein n=1 Tax=Streptococcus pneumoniae TaxID=1313 RepID=UPI00195311E0